MLNSYGDLTTLKSPAFLNTPDDTQDERLRGMLETASRWIDRYCDRHFYVTEGERRFDGTGRVTLAVTDLVSAGDVRVVRARRAVGSAGVPATGWPTR